MNFYFPATTEAYLQSIKKIVGRLSVSITKITRRKIEAFSKSSKELITFLNKNWLLHQLKIT
jgi:hypothetical protein